MIKKSSLLPIGLFALSAFFAGFSGPSAAADAKYPSKAIQLIVPYAAGGGTDAVGRVLAESLKTILKQDVVVVNKIGGAGAVLVAQVERGDSDGAGGGVDTAVAVPDPGGATHGGPAIDRATHHLCLAARELRGNRWLVAGIA